MNKEHVFDFYIWNELLRIEKKMGEPFTPTIKFISITYNVSNRIANAYRFAFLNRELIDSDISIDAEIKIATLRDRNRYLGWSNKKLSEDNKRLKAKIDFMFALEQVKEEAINPVKIEKSEAYTDECTFYSALSDIHIEEKIEASVMKYRNEYDVEIATARVRRYFKRLIWMNLQLIKGQWNIKKGVLALLGDLISGYIHEELMESNYLSPTEASMLIEELLIEGIKTVVNGLDLEELTIVCIRGNHGRTSKRKKFSTGYKNSFEWMVYTRLRKVFKDLPGYEHIKFIIPTSEFATVDVYGKTICNSHGDHFNYRGGVGGVMIPFMGWVQKMRKIIPSDVYSIAHWHSYYQLPSAWSNGSVVGYSPFAMGKAFEPEEPQQLFQLIDSKRGFTVSTPIKLTDF